MTPCGRAEREVHVEEQRPPAEVYLATDDMTAEVAFNGCCGEINYFLSSMTSQPVSVTDFFQELTKMCPFYICSFILTHTV